MIAAEAYVAFCLAALALAAVPGPTVTVIIANSLRFGARAGLLNVAGTIAAGLVWLALATLGLGAAIRVMGIWFDLLRYAGAIYLVWLGLRLLFSKGSAFDGSAATGVGAHGFFWQGFVVLLSNPKVLVLFGMLIPLLLGANGDIERGTLLLGGTFIIIAAVTDTVYALLAGQAGSWMSRSRIRAVEVVSGTFLAAAGVWMALKGRA